MKQHITHLFRRIFKPVVLSLFVVLLIASPRPATAQVTVLGDVQRVVQGSTGILDVILKGLETSAQVALKNGLRTFFDQIAYDTAVWIGSGDNNQKPLLFTKDAGSYIGERGDAAIGEILDTLGESAGIDLCNLPQAQGLNVQIQVNRLFDVPESPSVYQADCTATQIAASAENSFNSLDNTFTEAKIQFAANPQSIIGYYQGLFPKNNPVLAVVDAQQKIAAEKGKAENAAAIERLKSDYKDKTGKVAGTVETPAAVIEQNSNLAAEKSAEGETTLTGNVFADSLNIFANTLLSKLMDKAQSGLLSFFTQSDINESLRGSSSTSRGGGIREARLQFASYKTPPISSSGTLDILSQFATCPTEGADVTNCVITDEFRTAIDQQKTVKQLVEETNIGNLSFGLDPNGSDITDPNQGISVRNVKILRQYSVVPVGWELAAEYRKNYAAGTNVTLRQVMDEYEKCTTDNYSPYCGLIDPDWVLKAPEVFCKVDGYAENIGATSFIDNDGNPYTPQQLQVNRLKSCVDSQTCLSEDDTGACEAYGYCTKQKDIYRFEGESCPAHQASCEVFTDNTGAQVGYLKNTLNYNGCSSESDGCAWRCSVYNTVDQEFQCNGEDSIYNTCTSANGCSVNLVQADGTACSAGCTVANGGFRCSAEDQTCYLPGAQTNTQYSINFDNDVQPCNEADQSCSTFIPQVGSNLISNPSFERFSNGGREPQQAAVSTDPFQDVALAFAQADGSPCLSDEAGGGCYGWQQPAGGPGWRVVADALSGKVAVQSEADSSGALTTKIQTGHPLANRSFALSYKYINASGRTCEDQGTAKAIISTTDTRVGRTSPLQYTSGSGYQTIALDPYTFGPTVSDDTIQVTIGAPRDCNLIIDDVALIEITNATVSTAYQDYGATALNLKTSIATQCSPDDVGCKLYTPQTGPSRLPVPGRVTNPLSAACGNGSDFTNPACSQCFQQFVGCQAFVEEPTPYQAPLKEFAAGLEDVAGAIAKRTGFYCEGTATSCNPSRAATECGAGVACIPSLSVTPSTGDSCSAQDVGCEQYVNIDKQGAGGESLEYYSYIRQCVKPTETQVTQGLVDTYYSFEGSDQTGYQIRSWYLKKSNYDAGPCTNLDLTGGTAQSADAACVDDAVNQAVCSAAELGINPDCTEYFDATGTRYYRLRSATITVSESCTALRNSQDSRIYYTIPAESQTCSASANLCREYKGSAGNNERFIIDESFDGTVWGGGTSSATVASANSGQSMEIGTRTTSNEAATVVPVLVSTDKSYVATFWAKGDAGQTLTAFINSPSTGTRQTFGVVALTSEWQRYSVGPFVSSGNFSTDSEFGFSYQGASAYIDNVQVFENNSVYMIAGSATTCTGYEGCQEYQDQAGQTAYIKSFEKLCDENDAGCTALFNAQNSNSPFTETYHRDNEPASDDVIVPADAPETRIVKQEALCDSSIASCSAIGLPTIDASGVVAGFTKEFLLNEPDFYNNSLCTDEQLSCQAYSAADGSVQYFKNPGSKVCEYDEGAGKWKKSDGTDCPLQNPADQPSQPKGPVCDRGPREGELCSSDAECPTADDGSAARCVSDLDANSGWVGQCNPVFAGCTNYLDPNSEPVDTLRNTSFETDVVDNGDVNDKTPDNQPDFWSAYQPANNFKRAIGNPVTLCVSTGQSDKDARQFSGQYSLKVHAGSNNDCIVANDNPISVDPNKFYTLSGKVYVEGDAKFAIGLLYSSYSGEIATDTNTPESYAIAAYDGADRGSVQTGKWITYHALIGPNQLHEFPEGTNNVRIFLESYNGRTFFDDIEFAQADVYSYINSSVDGAPQADANTCNGTVDIGQGCVPFQELATTTNNTLSTLKDLQQVNADESITGLPCQTRASDGATVCDGTANAADSNVVLQVQRDRQCSQWLTCDVSDPVNINGQIVSSCLKFTTCTKLNPDTGQCIQYIDVPSASTLGTDDALTVVSQPGSGESLKSIKDYSGYTKVGIQWLNSEGDEVGQSQGYYPVDWMPERGVSGVKGTQDLVPDNDFESVTCNAEVDDSSNPIINATLSARDLAQTCTLDTHCRVQETETAALTALREAGSTDRVANIDYSAGWCQNVGGPGGSRSWKQWNNYNNAQMTIIDYDEAYQYETTTDLNGSISNPYPVAAKALNLNNVLYVQPIDQRESGVSVGLTAADISANENYVLSFDAKYIIEPPADSEDSVNGITAFLQIGTAKYFFTENPGSEPFRLSTQWKSYSLGPIAIGSLNPEDTAALFIAQVQGAKNTPFLIDNISLKPALEIAPDGGTVGSRDTVPRADTTTSQLVGRSCRSYPTAESASCNYTDTAGVIYTGWKGYCLEKDPLRPNGCIAWWPVSTITGESDLTRSTLKMRWTDQAPVYHCLVAKGNEDLGFCAGPGITSGEWCNTADDCIGGGSAKCVANEPAGVCTYEDIQTSFVGGQEISTVRDVQIEDGGQTVSCSAAADCSPYASQYPGETLECNTDDNPNFIESSMVYSTRTQDNVQDYDIKHTFDSKEYSIAHTLNLLYVDRNTQQVAVDGNNKEHAVFLKLEPEQLRLEQLVHISEIADIRFYDGSPIFTGGDENGRAAAENMWNLGSPLYGGDQELATSLGDVEQDGEAPTAGTKFDFATEGFIWDIFRRDWDDDPVAPNDAFHFGGGADDGDQTGVYAVQTGLWCGSGACTINSSKDILEDADFIYVKGISSLTSNPSADANILFNPGQVANNNDPLNPFQRFLDDLGPDSQIWNRNGEISQTGPTVAGYTPATDNRGPFFKYFVGRNMESIPDTDIVPIPNDVKCFGAMDTRDGTNACGANIYAVKFDFENGYLKNVYIIIYNGFQRADVKQFNNISWSFDLKEVCVFAVQTADDGAGGNVSVMPWRTRVDKDEKFVLPGLGYTYQLANGGTNYSNILFGMLALQRGVTPDQLPNSPDYNGGKTNITGKAGKLPLVYAINGDRTALPFACIGSCTEMICQQTTPYTANTFDPNNSSTCREGGSEPQWISLEGVCVNRDGKTVIKEDASIPCDPGAPNANQLCQSADSNARTCKPITEHEKQGTTDPSLNGKLQDAVASAWTRYRTIFADLGRPNVYTIEEKGTNEGRSGLYQHSGVLRSRSLNDLRNYTSLVGAPAGLSPSAQTAFPEIATTLSQFGSMPLCPNNERTSDSDYCAIPPRIKPNFPITVNGQTDANDVYLTSGTKAQIQFGALIDEDQQPLNEISVQYEASPDEPFDGVLKLWEAAPLENHTFEHVYTCDSTKPQFNPTAGREGVPACVYELRVQLKDYWGFCNLESDIPQTAANSRNCESYTKFNSDIIVELAQ